MGAFLSLLGGLSKGAGDTYGEIDKQNRENKFKNDSLVAEALHKEMTTNDQLTPDQQDHLLSQYLALKGIKDKKLVEGIKHAAGYHRAALMDEAAQAKQAPELATPQQTTPEGVSLPPTPSLPSLPTPPYQPKSVGQLKFEESRGRAKAADEDKYGAQREAARAALTEGLKDKLDLAKQIDDDPSKTPQEKERAYAILGVRPPSGAGSTKLRPLPNTMTGAALKAQIDREGGDSSDIETSGSYKVLFDPTSGKITNHFQTEKQTYRGTASLGSTWKKMFSKDAAGEDVQDDRMYIPILARAGGAPQSVIPEDKVDTLITRGVLKTMTATDGSTFLLPATETSTTQHTVNGKVLKAAPGDAQVAPAVPTLTSPAEQPGAGPNAASPAPAAPGVPPSVVPEEPRPVPGQPKPRAGKTATPSTPLPTAHAGSSVGPPILVANAGRPLTPEQKQKNETNLQNVNLTIGRIKYLEDNAAILGSLIGAGKITLQTDPQQGIFHAIVNHAMPLTNKEAHVAAYFQKMGEDIFQTRATLGATAVPRSETGLAYIEAQRGILGQKPEIIKNVLQATLGEFRSLRSPLVGGMKKYGYGQPGDDVEPNTPMFLVNPKTRQEIWSIDGGKTWRDPVTNEVVK